MPSFRSKYEGNVYAALVERFGAPDIQYEKTKIRYYLKQKIVLVTDSGTQNPATRVVTKAYDYYTLHTYTPDFFITSEQVFVEAKGLFAVNDTAKMAAVKYWNPDLDVRILFQRDGLLGKKQRYSAWCAKHGYQFSIFPRLPL